MVVRSGGGGDSNSKSNFSSDRPADWPRTMRPVLHAICSIWPPPQWRSVMTAARPMLIARPEPIGRALPAPNKGWRAPTGVYLSRASSGPSA